MISSKKFFRDPCPFIFAKLGVLFCSKKSIKSRIFDLFTNQSESVSCHIYIVIYDIRYRPHHGHLVIVSVHPVENVEELVEGVSAQVAKHHILQLFRLIMGENMNENENMIVRI